MIDVAAYDIEYFLSKFMSIKMLTICGEWFGVDVRGSAKYTAV